MSNAFSSRAGCPVPEIPAIEGSLVSSCDINPPPDAPFCFPFENVPINPPPSFNFGCYKFKANSVVGEDDCVLLGSISYVIRSGNGVPDRLPGNWLDILGSDFISSALAGCGGSTEAKLTVDYPNEATTGYCEPEFNFSLSIPCEPLVTFQEGKIERIAPARLWVTGGRKVIVTIGSSESSGEPGNGFDVERPCEFVFKPNLNIPCPEFFEDPQSTIIMNAGPTVDLFITPRVPPEGEEDSCLYDYSLDIDIPCPSIELKPTLLAYEYTNGPEFVITREDYNSTSGCSTVFQLSLRLGITSSACLLCDVSVSVTSGSGGFETTIYKKYRHMKWRMGVLIDNGACNDTPCPPP